MSEDRLARIEAKLDKLSDAVVAIARTEEQIATIFNTQRAMEARLDMCSQELQKLRERSHELMNKAIVMAASIEKLEKIEERVDELRMDTHDNTRMTRRISWAVGVFFTSSLAIATSFLKF